MNLRPYVVALVLLGGFAGAAYWVKQPTAPQPAAQRGGRRGVQQSDAPAPVTVVRVAKQTVPVYREGIGNVQALNTVTVRAQVDGRLLSVEFVEGQDVHKGDVLARIDPVIYKAQYAQSVAKKAQDEANLANARTDLDRYRRLAQTNAGPKQQADQQASTVAQLEAQVQSDQAAIDNAKATLDYTTIVSPLDGRVGLRQVDAGNIVHTSDANGIALVTQVKPIAVLFTLPQRDVAVTTAALAKGQVAVEIPSADGNSVSARGVLQSVDNQIDVTTGTIKLKASFPNDDLKLWPGQFVSIRVVVDNLIDAKVVPASAIRRGTAGNFVYVVDDDSKAVVKPVKLSLQNETIAAISEGVDVDQKVVVEGFARLTDGKAVEIAKPTVRSNGTDATSPASKPDRQKGEGRRSGRGDQTKSDGSPRSDGTDSKVRRRRSAPESAAEQTPPSPPSPAPRTEAESKGVRE